MHPLQTNSNRKWGYLFSTQFRMNAHYTKALKQTYKNKENNMRTIRLNDTQEFTTGAMKRFFLVEDSENFKIINFNLDEGVTFPVHSHDLDGELSIQILEGEGSFLGEENSEIVAQQGDILISQIREPHGVRAKTRMRLLVTIAPPI